MDLESQLSQTRAEIARIKREKEEVSHPCYRVLFIYLLVYLFIYLFIGLFFLFIH